MEGAPTLDWSIQNFITVTLMVLLAFAVAGLLVGVFNRVKAMKQQGQNSEAA